MCHFVLAFFSPFSVAVTSLGEERANLSAFRTFVRFVLVWICRFPLPLGVWEGLLFVIVALPALSSYLFLVRSRGRVLVSISFYFTVNYTIQRQYYFANCLLKYIFTDRMNTPHSHPVNQKTYLRKRIQIFPFFFSLFSCESVKFLKLLRCTLWSISMPNVTLDHPIP